MTAYRRTTSNFALQRAGDWARDLNKPLVVLSALRVDYPWATDRAHAFILDGIKDVDAALADTPAVHLTYVETKQGGGKGLLAELAESAAVIVADDAPVFFLPRMVDTAAARSPVLMEAIDHNGLLPLATTDRVFLRAYDLRRFLQKELPPHLEQTPAADSTGDLPLAPPGLLDEIESRWPSPAADRSLLPDLPLDHSVPATPLLGGERAAEAVLDRFVDNRLERYRERSHPDENVASGLSPYLHFGHVSTHQVLAAVAAAESWGTEMLSDSATGGRQGWWGMSEDAEGFLDQVVTWRELGYQAAARVPDNDEYGALPEWAQATLRDHADDPREYVYTLEQFDEAATHDEIWNVAQRQLRQEGTIHNYLRMLWGKKILEWSRTPQKAHDIMFELNNRYALDGRDPNSTSGIHWVMGRYDRPWGPERSIFGKVRYMSSDSARRKLRMKNYLSKGATLF
jgi:deoxyribodipyrimidine photo-lyase